MNIKIPDSSFVFYAHSFRVNGPKTNEDTDVTLHIDSIERSNLSPFQLTPPNTRLKVIICVDE